MMLRICFNASLIVLFTASAASAQIRPQQGFNFGTFRYGIPYGNSFIPQYYQYRNYTAVLPNGGYKTLSYFQTTPTIPFANRFFVMPNYSGGSYGTSGGFGSSIPDGFNPAFNQQRQLLMKAQNQARWNNPIALQKAEFDQWTADQLRRAEQPDGQPDLPPELIDPPVDQILTGKTLNELAVSILMMEKNLKVKKVDSGLCPPDLIEQINFAGGPAADAFNLFFDSRIHYAQLLLSPEFSKHRDALDEDFATITKALFAGQAAPRVTINRFMSVSKAMHELARPMQEKLSIHDSSLVTQFLNDLESAAKYLEQPQSKGVLGEHWQITGATVADLLRHMAKYEMSFGTIDAENTDTYFSLHRGILAYYARLSAIKK